MLRAYMARVLMFVFIAASLTAACSRSPEAQKARHLERGEKFFVKNDYKDAIIEYRNVLRIEPANPVAIRRLGLAHYQSGQFRDAFPYLRRAMETEPNDQDIRLKLGTILLVARQADDARTHATAVLERDAKNFDALLLLADSAQRPADVDAALRKLEDARLSFQDRPKFHIAVGRMYLKKRDMLNAEVAFKDAVARDPKGADAHTALAEFYVLKNDLPKAEEELKTAAALSPIASQARMRLADFYARSGKSGDAKGVLAETTKEDPTYLPAWRRLSEIALNEKRYDEALEHLAPVFKRNPADVEGQYLRGRIRLAKGQSGEAINDLQAVLKLEPKLTAARYQLAVAQLAEGNVQQAKAELNEVTAANPNLVEARLLRANLNMQTGAVQVAIDDLEKLVQTMPQLAAAHKLLGTAYLLKRDGAKAAEAFKKFIALAPKDSQGPYSLGVALAMQGKRAEAAKQFEAALALTPGYVEPLTQLVRFKFVDKDAPGAVELVKKQLAAAPKSGPLHALLGDVYLAQGKKDQAEQAFVTAVDLDPKLVGAYGSLAAIYADGKNYDQALAKLEQANKAVPKNLRTLMLIAMIHEQRGDIPKAQKGYEDVLAVSPRFAHAANNLAYLYAEHGGDKERALQLAQTAKEVAPDDPSISDTLGWILYQRGVYQRALALVQESAMKLPDNPTIQYHLGMIYTKVGNKDAAKKAFTAATASKRPFRELAAAKQALAELN